MEKLENKLGFNKIRASIMERCSTKYGSNRAITEKFSAKKDRVEHRLNLTDEMRLILLFETSFPSSGYVDSIEFLKPLEVDSSYLQKESLVKLKNSIDTLRAIISFFKSTKEGNYPNLKKMAEPIQLYPEINRRLDIILDRHGEIRDNASTELFNIRKSIREKEGSISRKIDSILKKAQSQGITEEGASVTIRDGRALIPVTAANKRKLDGFILDESATGKTVFIEPIEVVELNNQLKELYFAEHREVLKILIDFSDFLRPYLPELLEAAKFIGEIDFIRAKAALAISMGAGKPIISTYNELKIQKARHPILENNLKKEGKIIVPLSLDLTENKHILLISGPNAGGKSVCLKTVGLLQYMLQTGLLIPASESSEFRLFNSIFIDIGDEQSIENDLSTYSSHLLNMKNMLSKADNNSLVLIDEFGSGTEPTAGGAIAEAILAEIEARKCFGVITTHYTNLKFYANNSSGVINGAMLFDVQNIQPLFKLEIGLPGNSFAFELARKMGLPESILKIAEEKAGSDFVDIERHLRRIAKSKRDLDKKLAKIKHTDKTLESITDKYQKELSSIQLSRKTIIEEAKKEAKLILIEANKKIESTIKEIKESQAEKEKTKKLRVELRQFTEDRNIKKQEEDYIDKKMDQLIERKKRKEERKARRENIPIQGNILKNKELERNLTIQKGDNVRLIGSDMIGEVLQIDHKKATLVIGAIKSHISLDKIEKISKNEFNKNIREEKNSQSSYNDFGVSERRLNFKSSIDIRGYRLNDAIDVVCKLVDDALMFNISEVKILHGKGNGILKEEIRKYLKAFPGVENCKDEVLELGGSGITIVTL